MSGSFKNELSAIGAISGPQITRAELETKKYIAEMTQVAAEIAATPKDVKAERGAAALAAIRQKSDMEAVRAAFWTGASLPAKKVALMAARLQKERAGDTLNKFDALERGLTFIAIEKLIKDLEVIKRCMCGGEMPATKPAFGQIH